MNPLKVITTATINAAIAACDEMGREAFLVATGCKASRKFAIEHGGSLYDVKAVVCWAASQLLPYPVGPSMFSGGRAHANKALGRLGFSVIERGTK